MGFEPKTPVFDPKHEVLAIHSFARSAQKRLGLDEITWDRDLSDLEKLRGKFFSGWL